MGTTLARLLALSFARKFNSFRVPNIVSSSCKCRGSILAKTSDSKWGFPSDSVTDVHSKFKRLATEMHLFQAIVTGNCWSSFVIAANSGPHTTSFPPHSNKLSQANSRAELRLQRVTLFLQRHNASFHIACNSRSLQQQKSFSDFLAKQWLALSEVGCARDSAYNLNSSLLAHVDSGSGTQ